MSESENTPESEDAPAEGSPAEGSPAEGSPAEGSPAEGSPAEGGSADPTSAEGGSRPHRQARNYLLQPPFQVQLAIYNCVLALAFAASLVALLQSKGAKLRYDMNATGVPKALMHTLDSTLADSALYMLLLGLIFVLASVTITVILTHRLVGPAYAFRRQINELTSGKYEARIQLRKNDAFVEVAEELNTLAETLEREHGGLASNKGSLVQMD